MFGHSNSTVAVAAAGGFVLGFGAGFGVASLVLPSSKELEGAQARQLLAERKVGELQTPKGACGVLVSAAKAKAEAKHIEETVSETLIHLGLEEPKKS